MDLPSLGTSPALDEIMQSASTLGIEENLLDLVMYGFTVVPPEKVAPPELTERLREAILKVYERRSGHHIDDWRSYDGKLKEVQTWGWMLEDDAFLEAIHAPAFQTLGQFLTGKTGFLTGAAMILKTLEQDADLPLHTDSHGVPPPFPSYATNANLSWLLSDYADLDDGPTMLVPGSHRARMPRPDEGSAHTEGHEHIKAIPLQGPAGSLAVWNGSMWHGSVRRKKPGMRMTLVHVWQRPYFRRIEKRKEFTPEQLERWPDLPQLFGYHRIFPYRYEPVPSQVQSSAEAGRDQYG